MRLHFDWVDGVHETLDKVKSYEMLDGGMIVIYFEDRKAWVSPYNYKAVTEIYDSSTSEKIEINTAEEAS